MDQFDPQPLTNSDLMTRRNLILAALVAPFLTLQSSADVPPKPGVIFEQDLPRVSLDGWSVTAVEVRYEPGRSSAPHRHPGFVLGYVLEGEIKFQLAGGQQRVLHPGEMFYEPPGSVHLVSANASATEPARMLAMVFAKKGLPRSTPA
jgi:quercetin dioxygenase-like cupin family protein